MRRQTIERGFTLIELLVVIAIIGLLVRSVASRASGAKQPGESSAPTT